ncbi:MAG TPA: hypothetical protein VFW13_08035 [Phenylobacterium sp.]|nr:hypothetical protein [Phenylobacterium sp.]
MRKLIAPAVKALALAAPLALFAATAPAHAETVDEIAKHGMVVTIGDMIIDLSFTPDGKFSGLEGQLTGTWRIDGDKLCTTSNLDPNETCMEYPKGHKSGDSFQLDTPQGSVPVKIK